MRTFLLVLLLTALPATPCRADRVDVYTGEVVVASKGEKDRNQALPLALEHVLEKISGLRTFEDYPQVAPALDRAPAILLSFYYRNAKAFLADGSESEELRLVAKFSDSQVDEMMRTLELPLWPAERDSIDIWVVVDDGLDRRVMPVEFSYAWQSMAEVAAWRGLPLSWPVPDEEGIYSVDPQLLWGGYTEDLGMEPGRGVVIMAARREGVEWSVRSNMSYGSQSWTWRFQDIDFQAALAESLQQAVDMVAAANTIAASDQGAWVHQLTVNGLRNAADYERCLAYLQGLGVVTGVSVLSAGPGRVNLRLQLNALPRYLEESLLVGNVLGFDEDAHQYFIKQ